MTSPTDPTLGSLDIDHIIHITRNRPQRDNITRLSINKWILKCHFVGIKNNLKNITENQ